jgi:hypothetical protein
MREEPVSDTWMLERVASDRFDLTRNGRRLRAGLTVEEIRSYLKRNAGPRDKVYWEQEDGYLMPFR